MEKPESFLFDISQSTLIVAHHYAFYLELFSYVVVEALNNDKLEIVRVSLRSFLFGRTIHDLISHYLSVILLWQV